jgi:tetratricopeptide (TPR) repeat protein
LARYLAGEPIWSRPVSRVERYSKWCARNPWICLTSGIALASLLVSWGLTVRNNYELRQVNRRVEEERNTAETQRQSAVTARDEADRSQELALKAFQDLVDGVQQKLLTRPATEDLRRDLLATAQRGLEELAKNGGPAEASISKTYLTSLLQLADIYHMYGDSTGANRIHEQALSYAQQMQHAHPNDAELQMGLATIYLARSSLRRTRGKLQATRLDLETALRIQQALVDADPTNWTAQAAVAQTCGSLGHLAVAGSDLSSAFDYFRRSLRIQEQLIERDSDDAEAYVSLATMHRMLGDLFLFEREDAVKAKDCYLAAFHVTAQAAAIDPNNHRFWLTFAAVYRGLADTALRQGEEPLARAHYHKYLEWAVKISSAEPNSTRANGELRVAYERLGDQACRDQNWKDAHGAFLQELKVLARDVWGSPEIGLHVNTDYLVAMFLKLGDVRSAAQCLAMSRSILEATQKVDADRNLCLRMAALNHLRQADLAIQSESLTEAQAACSLAVQSAEQLVQLQSQGPDSQLVLAQCLLRQGTVQIQLALDHDNGYVTLNRSRRLLQEMPRPERPRHASRHEQLIADVDQMLLIGQSVAAAHQDLEVITKLQSEVRTDLLKLHGLDAIRHGNVELAIQSAEALNRVDDSDIRACFEAACLFGRCASQPIVAASPDTPGSATRDLSEKCLAQVGLILEHCEQHDFFRDIDQLGQLLSRPELASFRKTRSEHPVIKKYAGLLTP